MDYPQEKVKPYGQEGKKVEQVERMFDHIAPAYDRLNHLMSLGIDRSWRRTALKWLRPHRPQQMMDVATGTGDFALLACRMLRPQSLVGTDISEGMMQVARRKAREAGLDERISFRREDCEALTFADASFDAVTAALRIRNNEHLARGQRDMCRGLRPGGHLVILELSTPDRFPMKQLYRIYSRLIPLMGRLVSHDRSAYTYLPQSIRAFPQGEVMSESIRRAGFSDVRFRRLTFGVCTLYMATK